MAWSRVLGHDRQVEAFRNIVARHRLAHAYLFVGPAGIGKRRFAGEFAKALLCERATTLDACDRCEACLLVDAGTHPDLFAVGRPEDVDEVRIDSIRDFCRDFSLKAARGKGKIGILDDADSINEEAANCFLKTLEEPPPGSRFILIGTSSDRQLSTIKSRCQTVRFAPLTDDAVRQVLAWQGIAAASSDRAVRLAGGSPGQALALADDSLWAFRRAMVQALVEPRVNGFALGRDFIEYVEEAGKESALQRSRARRMVQLLMESFADVLRLQAGAPTRSAEAMDLPILEALAERANAEKILAMLERCLETETQLGRYVQMSLVVEGLVDALAQMLEHPGPLPLRFQGFG